MKTRSILLVGTLVLAVAALAWWRFGGEPSGLSTTDSTKTSDAKSVTSTSPGSAKSPTTSTFITVTPPKPAVDLAKVPETVRAIVDLQHNYRERLETARKLSANLSSDELNGLFAFLRERHEEDEGQGGHALKNDVMDALTLQQPLTSQIVGLFTGVYRDRNQHVVVRDYAVQHLAMSYERLIPTGGGKADSARSTRATIAGVLWEALSETDSTIAGTALMGLNRISESTTELDRNRLATTALKLAGDPSVGDATRISALQVGARLNNPSTLSLSIQLLEDETPAGLRLSAIGTIGLLGGRSELPTLSRIVEEGSPMLRPAAVAAMGRIQQRLTGAANTQDQL